MEIVKELLELLTEKFPPPQGTRHSFSLVKGVGDEYENNVADHPEVNVMLTLSTENGRLPVYFTDDELKCSAKTHFDDIVKLLKQQGLIEE